MNIVVENKNEKTLVNLNEERIDAHNSAELKDSLQQLLENGQTSLVVDLSSVRFIDSSGLGALLSGYKNASLRQGSLVLAGLQPRVQSMFELTRLHRVFEIYATVDEALSLAHEGERS
jgi:anti-sigma B factor antagonist